MAVSPINVDQSTKHIALPPRWWHRLLSHIQAQRSTWALVGILLVGAALRLWMLARGVPTLDSDEATIGLMALHLQHGELTVFMWGQHYMGSLEALLIAPFLWLFGPSAFTLRLAPLLLGLAGIATTYQLGVKLYSRQVGLLAALLLALGPPFFVILSVRAYGGYVETLLLGNLLLLLALHGANASKRTRSNAALLGLVAGLALWTNLLVLPYLFVTLLLCWLTRRTDLLRRNCWPALGGLLVGAAPAIFYNLFNSAATITTLLGLTVIGSQASHKHTATNPLTIIQHFWQEMSISLPILSGGFLGGTQAAGLTNSDYLAQAAAHPLLYTVSVFIALAAVALFLHALWQQRHSWNTLRSPNTSDAVTDTQTVAQTQQQGRFALLCVTFCYGVAFGLGSQPNISATPRYLFPLFAATPILAAELLMLIHAITGALTRWLTPQATAPHSTLQRQRQVNALVLAFCILPLCLWNLAGNLALTPLQTAARDHTIWIAGNDQQLLTALATHRVHTVISNDYWEGMRLTFESGETIITVMVTPEGHTGFNRYPPYIVRGLADPRPAYLELTGTPEATLALQRLSNGELPGYTVQQIGIFTLLLPA